MGPAPPIPAAPRRRALPPALLATLLTACSGPSGPGLLPGRDGAPPPGAVDIAAIPDAVPRVEPRSRYGNPDSYVVAGRRYYVMADGSGYVERGLASWYGTKFHGRRTSSGEPYDMYAMSAAHRSLPLPTYVQVTNLNNGRRVIVRVNDRGPFRPNRIIDLSYAAARKLGMVQAGTAPVEVRALDPRRAPPAPARLAGTADAPVRFYLQVGAFQSSHNAETLRTRLNGIEQPVQVQPARHAQQTVYRVRVGPVASVEEADRLYERLSAQGIADAHIVIE